MPLFGKKSDEKPKAGGEAAAAELDLSKQVHIMPSRYYLPPKKNNLGLVVAIIIGLLIIGVLSVAAFYLNETLKKASESKTVITETPPADNPQNPPVQPQPEPAEPTPPAEPTSTPAVPTSTNVNLNINANANSNANLNLNGNANINGNTNANTNTTAGNAGGVISSKDTDKDNLTDAEETLLGTDPAKADTDSDGYADGSEVLSGYDPLNANRKLSDSGLFTNYANTVFSAIYPKSWRLRESDGPNEVLFISGSGQFFEVLVLDKDAEQPLEAWFKAQFSTTPPVIVSQQINNFTVLKEADNLNYYLMDPANPAKVYLLTYNIGNAAQADYLTLFVTMVKSFRVVK